MKNRFLSYLVFLFSLAVLPAAAQTNSNAEAEQVYHAVEEVPRFPGGEAALMEYLNANLKYPAVAQRNNLEGMVVLQFIVSKTGEISDITVWKPLGGGLTEEAIRVVKSMPRWLPGKQNGKPVNVKFTLPVKFALAEPEPEKRTK